MTTEAEYLMKDPRYRLLSRHRASSIFVAGLILLTVFVSPVAAAGSTAQFEQIMDNLYSVILMVLKYAGLAALAGGAVVWFTARKNSDRAENGMWLIIGGTAMTLFYFGISSFVSVLEWIATNGA